MMQKTTLLVLSIGFLQIAINAAAEYPVEQAGQSGTRPYQKIVDLLRQDKPVDSVYRSMHPVNTVYNREAIIPPQCYTRTEQQFNPCYICHQDAIESQENVMNDAGLQRAYSFSEPGMKNHWKNLFEDRTQKINEISDAEIMEWVSEDNYSSLASRLSAAGFQGWIPDLKDLQTAEMAFDENGFAKDNSHWVAFNYKPLPSTFWPTNGSTDDVMIRLSAAFRENHQGEYHADIYRANLAIVEANIKGYSSIGTLPVDERVFEKDLNRDGILSVIERIRDVSSYVGAAQDQYIEQYLYPLGTEFLHTVRYLGFDKNLHITQSRRMKEVRYMRKWKFYKKSVYARYYEMESFDKEAGNLPGYADLGDHGLDNGYGWSVQGFIEDSKGHLRTSTYEENMYCMGCHSSIGSTIDKTFSFARKVDGADGWGYINLKGMPDVPSKGEVRGEIETYLLRVGGGSEFRNNDEMRQRWFTEEGKLDVKKVAKARDVYELITPSFERAMRLNKAYRLIVDEQDYIFGRDATVVPPKNVHDFIDNTRTLSLPEQKVFPWDIRLDWTGQ